MWKKAYALLSVCVLVILARPLYATNLQTVILNVTLNGQNKGDYFINLTDDKDIFMTRSDLNALGIERPSGNWISAEGELYLSLRALPGLSFVINIEALTLDITADPSLLPMQVIDFDRTTRTSPHPSSQTSAFLNNLPLNNSQLASERVYVAHTGLKVDWEVGAPIVFD